MAETVFLPLPIYFNSFFLHEKEMGRTFLNLIFNKALFITAFFTLMAGGILVAQTNILEDSRLQQLQKIPQDTPRNYAIFDYLDSVMFVDAPRSLNLANALLKKKIEEKDSFYIPKLYYNIALNYESSGLHGKSIENFYTAVAIFEKLKNYRMVSRMYNGIATQQMMLGDYKAAKSHLDTALAIAREHKMLQSEMQALNGLGIYYSRINDNESAIKYHKSVLALVAPDDLSTIYTNENNIGIAYKKLKEYDGALKYFMMAKQVADTLNDDYDKGPINLNLGSLYLAMGKYAEAELYTNLGLSQLRKLTSAEGMMEGFSQLKEIYAKLGQPEKALSYADSLITLKDSIFSQQSTRHARELEAIYDTRTKNETIAIQKEEISFGRKFNIVLVISIVLVLVVAAIIYINQKKTAKLNKIILAQRNELEQLGQVKDKIFSVVTHDMRAPVNSLIYFIEILEDGNIPQEKLAAYARELKQNLTYTSALMNNLLNWAASQMQGFKPVKEVFDLNALASEVIDTLQHHMQQKEVMVINEIPNKTPIEADRNMAAAILRNLLSNAIKYSYREGKVTVAMQHNDKGGWTFVIKDEGTGMQPQQLGQFNSVSNLSATSKRGTANEKGTGLGLMLCKTFASLMEGKITAESGPGGTQFNVWLPGSV